MNDSPNRTTRTVPWWIVALGAFLALVIGAGVAVVATRDGGGDETASGDTAQLVLEPLGTAGTDPFTESVATQEVAVLTAVSTSTGQADAELTVSGSQAGLYGGTQDDAACDAAALVEFLDANPDKAAAWAGVLGIGTGGIKDYVAGLTPVLLRTDTRVTNHGFSNGVATPRQAVLQAGTAVLVDNFGVPRVRCSCGNPLTEPAPLPTHLPAATDTGQVTLVGQPWSGWNPQQVVVVNATVEVNQFVVFDIEDETEFTKPVGSDVEPVSDARIVVSAQGIQVLDDSGAVVAAVSSGSSSADIIAELTPYLGRPSEEIAPPAAEASECPVPSAVRWGQLLVSHHNGMYYGWSVDAAHIEYTTGTITPYEPVGTVATDTGISIGSSVEQVLATDPSLTMYPNRLGRPPNYIQQDYYFGSGPLVYAFMPQVNEGVSTMGLVDEC